MNKVELIVYRAKMPLTARYLNNPTNDEVDKQIKHFKAVYGETNPVDITYPTQSLRVISFNYKWLDEWEIERREKWLKQQKRKKQKEENRWQQNQKMKLN